MKHLRGSLGVAVLLAVAPAALQAHFRLLEPVSWLIENARGDPQKSGPCGGTNSDWGKPSFVVSTATGGQKLHIKVEETVYHPGHYRVALAVNSPTELPRDPEALTIDTPEGRKSVSAKIQNPPQVPVIADGLWVHSAKVETPWEADVELPNITCTKCTLQVVQFMADHDANNPGNYTYHHCADLRITADPAKPVDKLWPTQR